MQALSIEAVLMGSGVVDQLLVTYLPVCLSRCAVPARLCKKGNFEIAAAPHAIHRFWAGSGSPDCSTELLVVSGSGLDVVALNILSDYVSGDACKCMDTRTMVHCWL